MKKIRNSFLLFSPFLILSVVIIVASFHNDLVGDEGVYLTYAQNLLSILSSSSTHLNLMVGPGYPLVIAPFVALKLPLISIALLNAVFYYLSIVYLYKALELIVKNQLAIIVSLFWAFYYNMYEIFSLIQPETLAPFLVSLLLYFLVKSFQADTRNVRKYILLSGFIFGYLALTKIIFGYVLLFMMIGFLVLWLLKRSSKNYKISLTVLFIALATTAPYLIYNYHITEEIFYWGNSGGNNMYWMSTPYEEEYGSWFPDPKPISDSVIVLGSLSEFRHKEHIEIKSQSRTIPGTNDYISFNHLADFEKISNLTITEKDKALKRMAVHNIKTNPTKFLKNCFSNLGRILFNYPYSYKYQKPGTLFRFPPTGILLVFLLFSIIPTVINWKRILFPIRFLIIVFCLYMGGSLIGSAETRMFTIMVPILLIWISFVIQRTVKINLKFDNKLKE